jgi:phosphoserine phosphatase
MFKKSIFGLLSVLLLLGMSLQSCEKDDTPDGFSEQEVAFKAAMRSLWTDHVVWTRDVIHGILGKTPETTNALNRLLQNQVDIGNAIKPYYGDVAGKQLADLLTAHIATAGNMLVAARDGNTDAFNQAHTAWYQNGDDIAAFLNSANPDNWKLAHMKEHMKDHLDKTLAEAVAHLEGRYADEVVAYDDAYEQLMHMADLLADGIIAQFPDKF